MSKNKFHVGDCVRFRDDLVVGQQYGGITFSRGMLEFLGHAATIHEVYELEDDFYKIEGSDYWYSGEMFVVHDVVGEITNDELFGILGIG